MKPGEESLEGTEGHGSSGSRLWIDAATVEDETVVWNIDLRGARGD